MKSSSKQQMRGDIRQLILQTLGTENVYWHFRSEKYGDVVKLEYQLPAVHCISYFIMSINVVRVHAISILSRRFLSFFF
jgi:hypothetical protein